MEERKDIEVYRAAIALIAAFPNTPEDTCLQKAYRVYDAYIIESDKRHEQQSTEALIRYQMGNDYRRMALTRVHNETVIAAFRNNPGLEPVSELLFGGCACEYCNRKATRGFREPQVEVDEHGAIHTDMIEDAFITAMCDDADCFDAAINRIFREAKEEAEDIFKSIILKHERPKDTLIEPQVDEQEEIHTDMIEDAHVTALGNDVDYYDAGFRPYL